MKYLTVLYTAIAFLSANAQTPVYPVRDLTLNIGSASGDVYWYSYTPIVKNGNMFEMYYTWCGIKCFANSPTGTGWSFVNYVSSPSSETIIKKGSKWYMCYHKRYNDSVYFHTSVSNDGINFPAGTPRFYSGEDMTLMLNNDSFYCYLRPSAPREDALRKIGLTKSSDFANWSPVRTILWIDSSEYNNPSSPDFRKQYYNMYVFRNGNDWWGIANMYRIGNNGEDVEQNPPYTGDEQTIEPQLLYSTDGINWQRTNNRSAFIPRTMGTMEVFALPTVENGNLWIYTIESQRRHTNYEYENVNGRWFGMWRYRMNLSDLDSWKPFASLNITFAIEGLLNINAQHNTNGQVTVYLRKSVYPYAISDSCTGTLDKNTLSGNFQMQHIQEGSYYIVVKGINFVETWSKNPVALMPGQSLSYDFTVSAAQAYGNNLIPKYQKFCAYSGDVNLDGFIELRDVMNVFNDAHSFTGTGDTTDLNGDGVVDLYDVSIVTNNSLRFARRVTP